MCPVYQPPTSCLRMQKSTRAKTFWKRTTQVTNPKPHKARPPSFIKVHVIITQKVRCNKHLPLPCLDLCSLLPYSCLLLAYCFLPGRSFLRLWDTKPENRLGGLSANQNAQRRTKATQPKQVPPFLPQVLCARCPVGKPDASPAAFLTSSLSPPPQHHHGSHLLTSTPVLH